MVKPGRGSVHIAQIASIFFGIVAVSTLIFSTLTSAPPYVVGENLILIQLEIFPGFSLKPMTLFTYSFFLSFIFGLNTPGSRSRVSSYSRGTRRAFNLIAWFVAMASGFEIVYHIVLWSASLAFQCLQNPDIIINPWPRNDYPINVVFSAKLTVLLFAISVYVIEYLKGIDRES
ncbi:MAG: hypothetical protein QW390_03720 [Candidatus Bathyarchaeia archaeon]